MKLWEGTAFLVALVGALWVSNVLVTATNNKADADWLRANPNHIHNVGARQ